MTGTTLGHFQILEKLGAGGMGEVYKARDTRLNRFVAIKVLPPDKVSNSDRKRRFIQEAQAASALNHPNIVVIHDINAENGVDYMVMEYIAGKTLDAAIPRQGMRLGEALKVAIPIADGLAKAHSAGIIHRDVKPSNIMIAEDDRVKILDFGLAKLTEVVTEPGDATRTVREQTEDGAILGTISYMSPEQAEGKKLDGRSDIFSFGAVLYEMLTGRKAFQADSRTATLSAILKEDPKAPENLPTEADRILRRCLRKDPARRFQSMADVKVELDEVREESESGALSQPVSKAGSASQPRWLLPVVVGSLLLAVPGIWLLSRPKAGSELRLRQLTADSGLSTTPAISADGKLVAYASDRAGEGNLDIWVQPLTEGAQPIRLTKDPSDDSNPTFSPDGGQIAFRSNRGDGGIYIVPALGGDERLVVRGGHSPRFSPDGQWIAYSSGGSDLLSSSVFVVAANGGAPRRVGEEIPVALAPMWSPDGKSLLVTGQDGVGDWATVNYWLTPVAGGKSQKTGIMGLLTQNKIHPRQHNLEWRGDSLLVSEGSTVWSMDFATGSLSPANLRKLTTGTAGFRGARGTPRQFVFSAGTSARHLWTLPLDLNSGKVTGPLKAIPHGGGGQGAPSSSAGGRVLAYGQWGPGGGEVRIRDRNTGKEFVLIAQNARPKLSPDGTRTAYSTYFVPGAMYLMDSAGGQARKLVDIEKGGSLYSWTVDGSSLVYYRNAPIRWYLFDLKSGKEQEMISHPKLDVHGAEPSPDMKWVAFHFPAVVNSPIKIAPLRDGRAGGEAEWITIAEYPGRNQRPWWSPDGNLLYFLSMKDNYPDIWAQRLDPVTKRSVGEAFAVQHFHETRNAPDIVSASAFGPAIGKDAITFQLLEQSGNIWIAETQ